MRRPSLDDLLVVVPVHDEEEHLGRCLDALARATHDLGPRGPRVRTLVVLDACRDGSAAVAAAHGVATVACEGRSVGAARALGVATLAGTVADARRTWVATTDADSRVPRSWLRDHVRAAAQHDLLVGSVVPDPVGVAPAVLREWHRRHGRRGHHVHGANLGVRLSAYAAAGGFPPLPTGEDVALVAAVRRAGRSASGSGRPVVTSSRGVGRAPAGFSAYLSGLACEVLGRPAPDTDSACPDGSAILVQSSGTPYDGRL